MNMTLQEKRELERKELKERKERELKELRQELAEILSLETIELLDIEEKEDSYRIKVGFELDGYRQEDLFYWYEDESQDKFVLSVKKRIDYIRELREKYSDYCKQNDYIQLNSQFNKIIKLTHMGYDKKFHINIQLADYMKLPNTTSYSCGGGDYEIKRTPKRVDEFNRNIDITIDALLDCISELKQRKYKNPEPLEGVEDYE